MNRRTSRLGVTAAAALLALTLGACSNDELPGDANSSGSPSPDSGASTTPQPSGPGSNRTPEERVEAALDRFLAARDDDYRQGKVNLKRLATVATEGLLVVSHQQAVNEFQRNKITITGEFGHEISRIKITGKKATATDCEDRSAVRFALPDGTNVAWTGTDGKPLPQRFEVTYTLDKTANGWRVSSNAGRDPKVVRC